MNKPILTYNLRSVNSTHVFVDKLLTIRYNIIAMSYWYTYISELRTVNQDRDYFSNSPKYMYHDYSTVSYPAGRSTYEYLSVTGKNDEVHGWIVLGFYRYANRERADVFA